MAASLKRDTRNYDLFKGVVTLILVIIIVILLLQGQGGPKAVAPAATVAPEAAPVAMALPGINNPVVAEGGAVSLSGTGQPGATVELWSDGASLGSVVVGADGNWAWSGTLKPGDHSITAHTLDASGKTVNESSAVGVSVPQTAAATAVPAAPATVAPAAPAMVVPTIDPPVLGEGGNVSLTGTGEPGATVEVWAGDAKLGSATVGADGKWAWSGTLKPGDHTITARTVDASGKVVNESPAVRVGIPEPAVPTAVPAPAVPTIDPPVVGDGGNISLSGTGEPGATVELFAGNSLGKVTVGPDGRWAWSGTLPPGDYTITAGTVDASGVVLNESEPLPVRVTVPAAAAPVIPTLGEPQVGASGTVTLTGTGEPGATVEIVEDGVVVGTAVAGADGTWTATYKSTPGAHQLVARSQAAPEQASAAVGIDVPEPPAAGPATTPAPAGEGEGYIVKPGDNLSALAKRFYGNGALWRLIFDATNKRAAEDPSFHAIAKPGFIRPGWKIWIPAR